VISTDVVTFDCVRFAWPGSARFRLSVDAFSLARGERLLLIGPSGSGKSTFLSLLAGIVTPDQGRISVLGTDLGTLKSHARDRFRAAHFGIIFQQFNLLPYASVVDNVVLPLSFSEARRTRAAAASGRSETEAWRLLNRLGLDAASIDEARASSLSVGQQQRVAAARALIGSPELIVADEPTSSLDRGHQMAFLDLLFADLDAAGTSLIMVSHDETLAQRFTRVVRLDDIAKIERGALA
jgi:putative ABC transport system ATP-binding protein